MAVPGLGYPHQADKKRLRAQLARNPGQPCWRCGQPMYPWQELDRDHIIDRALGGTQGPAVLAHASCNRSAGARLGNAMQAAGIKPVHRAQPACAKCGQEMHHGTANCQICGRHYHPSRRVQYTCSRACGVIYRRLKKSGTAVPYPPAPAIPQPQRPLPACAICGKDCPDYRRRACSSVCADELGRRNRSHSWELRRQSGNYGPMTLRSARQW
jgi:hypothetical protein